MKTPRVFSLWSVLPLVVAWDMWSWLEEALARLGTRRQEAGRGDW